MPISASFYVTKCCSCCILIRNSLQVRRPLCRTSVGLLWAFYKRVSIINAAKIFGTEVILCRRLENLDRKVTYKACESSYVISTSAWVYFFEKSFRVPKVVPKVIGCIIIFIQSMNFLQTLLLAVLPSNSLDFFFNSMFCHL